MSDSDAFVGDSFSMISPSPLARQPLRRMQEKTGNSKFIDFLLFKAFQLLLHLIWNLLIAQKYTTW